MKLQSQLSQSPADYDGAALTLNGMSMSDIQTEVASIDTVRLAGLFAGAMRTMLLWPPPLRVADAIYAVNPAAARQGRIDYFREVVNSSDWHRAVLTLNGFSDPDIVLQLTTPPLTVPQLIQIRAATVLYMLGWNARILLSVTAALQAATAGQVASQVGRQATWVPSRPGSHDTFETWASAPAQGAAPAIEALTSMNCWEMVLLAAFQIGTITWSWIHEVYTASGAVTGGDWGAYLEHRLTPGGRQAYDRATPAGPQPQRGDIVFFNGVNHVAMAVGSRDSAGRQQVYSFWPPPGTAFTPGGTLDNVKITTIEELADFMDAHGMGPVHVEFGPGPW